MIASPLRKDSHADESYEPYASVQTNVIRALGSRPGVGLSPGGVVGQRGPIPKRDDERIRRNVPEEETTKVPVIGTVEVPDLNLGVETHPIVIDLYESLKDSGQARFFEPSDWQFARLTMYTLNDVLMSGNISAMKLQAINGSLSNLLITEADRRRVRMEVERQQSGPIASVTQISDMFREQLLKKQP